MQKFLNNVVKCSVYALVFLLPLFFLPFSYEVFEFNKQYLLFFLTTIAAFAWLAKMVIYDKEVRFRKTSLDVFVLAFLGVGVLSAVLSVDKSSSLFGFYGRFSDGLISLLSMGILYFLITNNVGVGEDKRTLSIGGILKAFLWSSAAAVTAAYLAVFGIFARLGELIAMPAMMTQRTFNMISGSLEGLSVFLAVVIGLLVGLMTTSKGESKKGKLGYWLLLLASLGLLLVIDFTVAWIILLVSLFLFVGFSLWKRIFKENVNKLLIPILLVIIAAVSIPTSLPQMVFGEDATLSNLPREQVLSQGVSWQVSFDSATDSVKNALLGSGLGTFHYDFSKHKPIEVNDSWMWQIRFDRAGNHFAGILATMGFFGLLSYLAIIGIFLMMGYLLMLGIKNVSEAYPFQIPLLLVFLVLLVGQFVYYQNTTLGFAFWLILGLSMVSWRKPVKEKVISFRDFPELSLILSTIVIILGVAILALYFFGAKFYLADANYNKALSFLGEERTNYLTKAVNLNPYSSRYRVALSRTYLYDAVQEMGKETAEQNTLRIQTLVAKAIDEARTAASMQENQVTNWENLGVVYREIIGVAQGAVDWGINSFERALEYEPTNPVLYTEMGKLYSAKGETEKAKEYFTKAKEVKPDYAEATIQLALLLESEDVMDEAITEMEDLVESDPFNVEALFQLGRLYFNNNRGKEAIDQFKMVTLLVPDHSNAHYSLGVAYASQNERELAIEEFERVLELNPGNQDVIQKIRDLRETSAQEEEEAEAEAEEEEE